MRAVRAKQANTFVLHGVTADLVPVRSGGGPRASCRSTSSSPSSSSPAGRSIVTYNRAEGLGFATPEARAALRRTGCAAYDAVHGTTLGRRRCRATPRTASRCSTPTSATARRSQPARPVVLLLPFAETLVPAAEAS